AVLAQSIANEKVDGELKRLLWSVWLVDIDTERGEREVRAALTQLPKAKLLRVALAGHFMVRVYWRHWDKAKRLKLLDLAEECLKVVGGYDKAELQRLIRREKERIDGQDEE